MATHYVNPEGRLALVSFSFTEPTKPVQVFESGDRGQGWKGLLPSQVGPELERQGFAPREEVARG